MASSEAYFYKGYMKREIISVMKPGHCCPGHDKYPSDTYKNRRSKKQRSLYIKKEHRHVRRVVRVELKGEVLGES